MDLRAAAEAVVGTLTGSGVPAALDMRDLNLPGFYVAAPTLTYRFGGCWEAEWAVFAVTMNAGRAQALAELGVLIDAAREALGGVITTATPADMDSLDGGPRLPAYRLTWTSRVEGP